MSERNHIKTNVNGSRNTRMDLDHSASLMDYRCDEIMFLARYNLGAQTIIDLSKELGRPIRVLDVGCGQMNTVRLLYKSFQVKKSDVIEDYCGIDIDDVMVERCLSMWGSCYEKCSAHYVIQDLTVDPHLSVNDSYYDLIICTEFLEHINPEFS